MEKTGNIIKGRRKALSITQRELAALKGQDIRVYIQKNIYKNLC